MKKKSNLFTVFFLFYIITFCSCNRVSLDNNLGFNFTMDSIAKDKKLLELIKDNQVKKVKELYLLTWYIPNLDSAIQSILNVEFDTYEKELNHLINIKLDLVRDTIFMNHYYPFSDKNKKEPGYIDTVLRCPIDINSIVNIEKALTNYLGKPDSIIGSIKKIGHSKQNDIEDYKIDIQLLRESLSEERFDEKFYLENQLYGKFNRDRIKSKKVIWKKNDKIIILDYSYSVNDGSRNYDSKTGEYFILFGPKVNADTFLFYRYADSYETNKWYQYPSIRIVSSNYFKEVYKLRKRKRDLMKVEDYIKIRIDYLKSKIQRFNNSNQFELNICLSQIHNNQIYNLMPITAIKFKFAIYDKFDDLIIETDNIEHQFRKELDIGMLETNYFGGWCYKVFFELNKNLDIDRYTDNQKEFFEKEIKIKPIVEAIVFKDGTVLKRK